ncbi:MAG: hypothetical protein LGB70_04745 [Sulfurovum sp.]|nr:hypothetical protein [Sulfurovum sp.]MCB4782132.1 hypothetical protein [Sulfurovum sp.]
MSQVTMLFLFPIAIYLYFFKGRPSRPVYYKVFNDFQKKVDQEVTKLHTFKKIIARKDINQCHKIKESKV